MLLAKDCKRFFKINVSREVSSEGVKFFVIAFLNADKQAYKGQSLPPSPSSPPPSKTVSSTFKFRKPCSDIEKIKPYRNIHALLQDFSLEKPHKHYGKLILSVGFKRFPETLRPSHPNCWPPAAFVFDVCANTAIRPRWQTRARANHPSAGTGCPA